MPQQPMTRPPVVPAATYPSTTLQRSHWMREAEQLNLAMAVWDLRCMEVQFSSALEQLYGWGPGEFQGHYAEFLNSVHPDDRHPVAEVIATAVETGQPFEVDYRIINNTGTTVWLASSGRVLEGGVELVEVVHDVTPRYQARSALAESNAQWDALLKRSDELLLQLDQDAHVFWASPSSAHLLGYLPDVLIGEPVLDLVHPEDVHKILRAFESLKSRQLPQSFQHQVRQQSGQYLPVQATLRLGEELGCFAVLSCREISARVNLQSVLDSTYAAYTAIVDSTSDWVYRFLPDGAITFANQIFWDSFGIDSDEGIGTTIYSLLVEEDGDRLRETCAALTPEQPTAGCLCWAKTTAGLRRQDYQCHALFDSEGILLEYQVVGKELETEQVRS